jgi:glutathione synthase/RimK-type ligase-like ATP-grasp enzyme
MCRKVARVTGLIFTAIDMRRTLEGEYIVLEANSSPDFYTDEYYAGHPIAEKLVSLLAAGAKP